MHISNVSNTSFNGYDAMRLRGLYMQGLVSAGKRDILLEMKDVAKKENLEFFMNETIRRITKELEPNEKTNQQIFIWGQDVAAFVKNKFGKQILWNSIQERSRKFDYSVLDGFKIHSSRYMPRGGNYYLGYKENGEKWLIINSMSLASEESFKQFGDLPTERHLLTLFDIKPENIIKIKTFSDDLDRVIRPVGYPYVLVNDSIESLKLVEKMHEKFPENVELYEKLKKYIVEYTEYFKPYHNSTQICEKLEQFGFKPIKIGARFYWDVDYINALSWVNNENNLSYVTNSTKGSCTELEYLEKLFDESLKEKMPRIKNSYYVNGGGFETETNPSVWHSRGLNSRNVMMDILANRNGGIHCMTAEIPVL